MAREYYTHTYANGNQVHHELGGVIYAARRSKKKSTHYISLLNPASPEELQEQLKEELRKGITEKEWSRKAAHSLVRYGQPNAWHYFPVPLLFKTDEEIRKESEARGIPAMPDGWYRRKRNLILKIVGFPEIP